MLSLDDFSPVTLDSKPLFDAHYKKYPPVHSDYVFTTMISWNPYAHYEYCLIAEALIIKTTVDGIVQFRPPIGKIKKKLMDDVVKLAKKQESTYPLTLITEHWKTWLQKKYSSFEFFPLPEHADYVYRSEDLLNLKGSDYKKIRNRLNKFIKTYSFCIDAIHEENIAEIKQFLKRWCIWKECEDDPLLAYEKKAVIYAMDHFIDLGLSGISVRVDDHIEAIAIYEQMNPETVVVHFEKGSPYFDGIYKLVNQETARIVVNDASFINRESDMGNPGLRKAKQSYRPDHMINVYKSDIS